MFARVCVCVCLVVTKRSNWDEIEEKKEFKSIKLHHLNHSFIHSLFFFLSVDYHYFVSWDGKYLCAYMRWDEMSEISKVEYLYVE